MSGRPLLQVRTPGLRQALPANLREGQGGFLRSIITCHLGNGASVDAVKDGWAVDTSMGFTPLEGLMMGSRTGDIDTAAPLYIMKKEGLSPEEMDTIMNKKSGLLGVTGISSDMREIEKAAGEGNELAILALDMYSYRIKKYISSYTGVLGGLDVLVFTAGVGENAPDIREKACEGLEFLGIEVDRSTDTVYPFHEPCAFHGNSLSLLRHTRHERIRPADKPYPIEMHPEQGSL